MTTNTPTATKKVRANKVTLGMVIAGCGEVVAIEPKMHLGTPGSTPWTTIRFTFPEGSPAGSSLRGSSEWVEINR